MKWIMWNMKILIIMKMKWNENNENNEKKWKIMKWIK